MKKNAEPPAAFEVSTRPDDRIVVTIAAGAPGPAGPAGEGVTVFSQASEPTANQPGDLWLEPAGPGLSNLYVWDGSAWVSVAGSSSSSCSHVVSETVPPAGAVGDLWINPACTAASGVEFDADNPITVTEPLVTSQTNGDVIGLSADGQNFYQPMIVGAVPIVVDGVRYMIPVIEE